MKNAIKTLLAVLTIITLCSFGFNKPDHVQRRKGIMNVDEKGRIVFTPLEDWKDFTPVNDTCYQYVVR